MSAMSFLYLFTGCLDLALKPGQRKQREPQAGRTCREITPDTVVIFIFLSIFPQYQTNKGNKFEEFLFQRNKIRKVYKL
jgi:aromatic ring-opening dioxygenase catalytic subunit (LigB family)